MNCVRIFFLSSLSLFFLHKRIHVHTYMYQVIRCVWHSTRNHSTVHINTTSTTEKTDKGRSPPNNCVTLARYITKKETNNKQRKKQQTKKERTRQYLLLAITVVCCISIKILSKYEYCIVFYIYLHR